MLEKGESNNIAVILLIVIVVGIAIIMTGFGSGFIQGAEMAVVEGATQVSSASVAPVAIDSVDLSTGCAYIRSYNPEFAGTIDAIYITGQRFLCNPAITLTQGTNEICFSDCNVDINVTTEDCLEVAGPNILSPECVPVNIGGGDTATTYDGSANLPPLLTNIQHTPASPTDNNTITLSLTATDASTNITSCSYSVDVATCNISMNATDGSFDETSEAANITIGPLSAGSYTVYYSCTDSQSNASTCANNSDNITVTATPAEYISLSYYNGLHAQHWDGSAWSCETVDSNFSTAASSGLDISINPANQDEAIAVYEDGDVDIIYYSDWNGTAWSTPTSFGSGSGPSISFYTDDLALMVYDDSSGSVFYTTWHADTRTFDNPAGTIDGSNATNARVDAKPDNQMKVVWEDAVTTDNIYSADWNYLSDSWTNTLTISSTATNTLPDIAVGETTAMAVWEIDPITAMSAYYNGSSWESEVTVSTSSNRRSNVTRLSGDNYIIGFSTNLPTVAYWDGNWINETEVNTTVSKIRLAGNESCTAISTFASSTDNNILASFWDGNQTWSAASVACPDDVDINQEDLIQTHSATWYWPSTSAGETTCNVDEIIVAGPSNAPTAVFNPTISSEYFSAFTVGIDSVDPDGDNVTNCEYRIESFGTPVVDWGDNSMTCTNCPNSNAHYEATESSLGFGSYDIFARCTDSTAATTGSGDYDSGFFNYYG